ncbi:hypothetical protein BOTBODRAFT_191934 [Botryobasidium botryosum FD-172 SS1]|uniref:Uncharacterized protein n=1 Tax=Botryobasidium botryosum (strain FD-172 SS1) TaxID=930990 RepID=A0A067M995_BOTB1|nr:hypothetical protein BOTBODRAFT_191934 [Botryobasidium botryosum FD-172 SS1]
MSQLHRWARFVFRCNYVIIPVPALNLVAGSYSPSSTSYSPPSLNSSGSGVTGAARVYVRSRELPRLRILDIQSLPFSHDRVLKAGSASTKSASLSNKTIASMVREYEYCTSGHSRTTTLFSDSIASFALSFPTLPSRTSRLGPRSPIRSPILPIKPLRLPCLECLDISAASAHRFLAQLVVLRPRELGVTSMPDDFAALKVAPVVIEASASPTTAHQIFRSGMVSLIDSDGTDAESMTQANQIPIAPQPSSHPSASSLTTTAQLQQF